ncbi:MAG: DEAD/DEAH box helicase, partial [Bacteroidota bacterium]
MTYFPRGYTDASEITPLAHLQINELTTFEGILSNFFSKKTKTGKFLTRALFTDETGSVEIIWFNQPHITRLLPAGKRILLTGKPKRIAERISIMNPIGELKSFNPTHTARIIPVYHETKGITSKWLRSKIKQVLETHRKTLEEYMPEEILKENDLMDYADAVSEVHFPSSSELLEKSKKRLAFDELFLLQLRALQKKWLFRSEVKESKKIEIDEQEIQKFLKLLPFTLTSAQKKVLEEILQDLEKPYPMSRLLQGDVGSGKTIIAAAACYLTIKAGHQAAIMAPTEILAKQHFKSISKVLFPHGISVQILAGSTNDQAKREIYRGIETGTLDCM